MEGNSGGGGRMAGTMSLREQIAQLQLQLAAEEIAQQERQKALEEEARHKVPRMRTAKGAVEVLRQEDPGTQVTESMIRRLIRSGQVPFVKMGKKHLVNVETLISYLQKNGQLENCAV